MTHTISGIENFDAKRVKVTLDYSEVAFLLYKGECRSLKIEENGVISEEDYRKLIEEVLIPRAKKRVLYFLKNADKTRSQIRNKLKEGLYPDEVIEAVMQFLDHYGFANDTAYAERYIEELKGSRSRREIEAKLMQRGLKGQEIREQLSSISTEDEYEAAERALQKKYPRGFTKEDRNKAYGFLARKGYSFDAIEHAMNAVMINA